MSHFLKVRTVDEVLELLGKLESLSEESVTLDSACGRRLAASVRAPEAVPHFDRAVMDGYAVRAQSTFGASETLPALLEVSGEVTMGHGTSLRVEPGQAVALPTGGMLPVGADAVVMVEYTQPLDARTIEVTRAVAPGENVLRHGEDIAVGEELLPQGMVPPPPGCGHAGCLGDLQRGCLQPSPRGRSFHRG